MKMVFYKLYNRGMSKTLLFHLFLTAIMQGTCIGLIRFYCSQVLALGLSIFLLIEIIFFIRQIFAPIMKIERKIDELERENKKSTCDGTEDTTE